MRRPNPGKVNLTGSPHLKRGRYQVDSAETHPLRILPKKCSVAVELFRIVDLG
ncbi:hypothetical protein Mal52_05860 [Symmachiella dynata]|uniref:Uncharacterized protein n=1 Tax=Symmachiella dynata TaxID=2527995 RepID=A0A517ZI33_9PLAN|nr:hypothetical protein Mal52_05860 [Symmachiella dynata]